MSQLFVKVKQSEMTRGEVPVSELSCTAQEQGDGWADWLLARTTGCTHPKQVAPVETSPRARGERVQPRVVPGLTTLIPLPLGWQRTLLTPQDVFLLGAALRPLVAPRQQTIRDALR